MKPERVVTNRGYCRNGLRQLLTESCKVHCLLRDCGQWWSTSFLPNATAPARSQAKGRRGDGERCRQPAKRLLQMIIYIVQAKAATRECILCGIPLQRICSMGGTEFVTSKPCRSRD